MKVLVELDKAGAEWVVVAYLSGDPNMLSVISEGKSPHVVTGSLISGAPEEFVIAESKIVGHLTDPVMIEAAREEHLAGLIDPDWFMPRIFSIRQMGKKSNHGLNYNMKYRRFALENEMDEKESKSIVNFYRTKAYPGIPVWHTTIDNQLRKDRTLINCFGRKRKFMDAWGTTLCDAAYAFLPQSTVFDITRIGMTKFSQDETDLMEHTELMAQVHDSCVFHIDFNSIEELTEIVTKIGLDYMNPLCVYNSREFKLGTTMSVGIAWGEGMIECELSDDKNITIELLTDTIEQIKYGKEAA